MKRKNAELNKANSLVYQKKYITAKTVATNIMEKVNSKTGSVSFEVTIKRRADSLKEAIKLRDIFAEMK